MKKRCTATLSWILVLAMAFPAVAQDEDAVAPTPPVLTTGATAHRVESTETWKDVVVIPRKPFLKRGRVELMPLFSITRPATTTPAGSATPS